MESSVIVKVKYGDTLRRFNALVDENQQMALDIDGLRAKIRSLFNFAADADLKLTYVDEDLDMVALVDEEDLCDVVKQGLNPVRITVQLNTGNVGSTRASGKSTPVRLHGHNSNATINTGVADLLKSLPEPLHETLSKLSVEMASKATSSSPVLADFIERITKVGQSFLNGHQPPQSGGPANVSASQEAGERHNKSWTAKDASTSGDGRGKHDGAALTSNCCEEPDLLDVTKLVNESATNQVIQDQQKSSCANLEALKCNTRFDCDRKKAKDINDASKRKLDGSVNTSPVGIYEYGSSSGEGTTVSAVSKVNRSPISDSVVERNVKTSNECPFSGLPMRPPMNFFFPPVQQVKNFGHVVGCGTQGDIFHRGVQCDGCGVLPITGPRFKSKVKYNYDLCSICFKQMGNDADYTRIDFPTLYQQSWSFKSNPTIKSRPWAQPSPPLFPSGKHMKHFRPKLDSRFIKDVSVMDGTILAPNTCFTKIWRMRNSGNLPWTRGIKLVWIGGDKFSLADSVEIELPAAGHFPEDEVDVAIDFIAPALPGRYISYWKMASPSGQKFGQRVWVLIQVDAASTDLESTVSSRLNLNLLPEGAGENIPQHINMDVEPLVDVECEPSPVAPTTEMQKPLVDEQQNKLNLPDDLLYDPFAPVSVISASASPKPITPTTSEPIPAPQVTSSTLLYPASEAGITEPAPESSAAAAHCPVVDVPAESTRVTHSQVDVHKETEVKDAVEEALLKELEEMGFKQVDLNREILRKNNYNLEQSLDELCGFSEWDLLLEELQGMGFIDREMNKRVLAKNNGSLKHAVMDLIARENA